MACHPNMTLDRDVSATQVGYFLRYARVSQVGEMRGAAEKCEALELELEGVRGMVRGMEAAVLKASLLERELDEMWSKVLSNFQVNSI